eukprot:CAMPEP_0177669144 /NCGR_PEP_ID=MMETSP0447-20121125/23257_1 /TAXON_ID=0 /ORGANISM="Stygamoeba regulata, Strain BSH-02190019" /LENGTH=192 /DNA_ID=CAMNT_0019175937 /DNA_START=421 /DNA_END=999 /DNA_ORIENTATION=+
MLASASYLGKTISIHENRQLVREMQTIGNVSQISHHKNTGLVMATEAQQLCLWDHRAHCPLVSRLPAVPAMITALACHGDGALVGLTGTDHVVTVYDPRKWSVLHHWRAPLKYEAAFLELSLQAANLACFAAGSDSQLVYGHIATKEKKTCGFQADSRWMGLSKVPDCEMAVGITESGGVYALGIGKGEDVS